MKLFIDKRLIMTLLILFIVITGLIGYSYINSDLNSSLSLNLSSRTCNQSNLNERLTCMSTPDNIKSKYVSSNNGISFSDISSDTNGKGLYIVASTLGDTHPISYYRGDVSDNNLKFGGFCWKIVRTTETGGTKLIYNGEPDGSGHCTDRSNVNTYTEGVKYNDTQNASFAYIGYMYDNPYALGLDSSYSNYLFGSSYSYSNGTFTLSDTDGGVSDIVNHHYTCLNDTGTCSQVAYVTFYNSNKIYYILLDEDIAISDVISEMKINSTSSSANSALNTWYNNNLSTYSSYIEDTIWCNDREPNTNLATGNYASNAWYNGTLSSIYFAPYERTRVSFTPTLKCSQRNDSFTVYDAVKGNAALSRPIGLLTADEVMYAGAVGTIENTSFYLDEPYNWWTLSPDGGNTNFYMLKVESAGTMNYISTNSVANLRPSISLANYVNISSGDGSEESPYEVTLSNDYSYYTLTNLVQNGSFEDGITNWSKGTYDDLSVEFHSSVSDFKRFGAKSLKRLANNTAAHNFLFQRVSFIENHQYYYFLSAFSSSASNQPIANDVAVSANASYFSLNVNNATGWVKGSKIYTSAATEERNISINYGRTTAETYVDGVGVVDLTEAFGAGNEPTKEWCDDNINYFDGTMVIAVEN